MKPFKIIFLVLVFAIISITSLFAQQQMEDVIYLKNGTVYRGIITEQVPNVSMKIQINGGSVFAVTIPEIEKITKENKPNSEFGYNYPFNSYRRPWHMNDSTYIIKKRGYFFNAQVLIENLQGGVRIVNGYKFNRFAYLGIGIGVDNVYSSPYVRSNYSVTKSDYSGIYLPLYLSYSGEFFNKRFTPFYAIEGGYAMAIKRGGNPFKGGNWGSNMRGGGMASLGLGFKLQTSHKVNLSILFNINMKQLRYTDNNTYFDVFGNPYTRTEKVEAFLFFPGIRLGLGF